MRKIKFRGKDEDTGEWRYGGIVHQTDFYGLDCDKWFIITGTETNDYDIGYPHLVEEKSIGQFTGLKDKNGKEIYEGDVVKYYDVPPFSVVYYDEKLGAFILDWKFEYEPNYFDDCDKYQIEVIGNIYENPDLLGE